MSNIKKVNKLPQVYPFIDKLVDTLYTEELNKIIEEENVQCDKKTFLMFLMIYFYTRVFADKKSISKESIKEFMTDLIKNPSKRKQCIDMFYMFDGSIGAIEQRKNLQIDK